MLADLQKHQTAGNAPETRRTEQDLFSLDREIWRIKNPGLPLPPSLSSPQVAPVEASPPPVAFEYAPWDVFRAFPKPPQAAPPVEASPLPSHMPASTNKRWDVFQISPTK